MVTLTRPKIQTDKRTVYTLRQNINSILALKPHDKRVAVIGFQTYESAHKFGRLIESYNTFYKDWPDFSSSTINLMDDGRKHLSMLAISQWDIEILKKECALRYLNLLIVDEKLTGKIKGVYMNLELDTDILASHLNFIWGLR